MTVVLEIVAIGAALLFLVFGFRRARQDGRRSSLLTLAGNVAVLILIVSRVLQDARKRRGEEVQP
jgi:hypothetical protein